jgi:RNA polymerase sigma factor
MRYIDEKVIDAKKNTEILEELIKEYEHFMLSCAAKTSGHYIDKSDDEWSVALLAFYEAVQSYEIDKGRFLIYARMLIRSRLIDYFRAQNRHFGQVSLELVQEV